MSLYKCRRCDGWGKLVLRRINGARLLGGTCPDCKGRGLVER